MPQLQLDYTPIVIVIFTILSTAVGWLFVGRKKLQSQLMVDSAHVEIEDDLQVDNRLKLLLDGYGQRLDDQADLIQNLLAQTDKQAERLTHLADQNAIQAEQIADLMSAIGEKEAQLSRQSKRMTYLKKEVEELKRLLEQYEEIVNQWGKLLVDNSIIKQVEIDAIMVGIRQ